ncbi:MAG: hypothetical protein ABSC17_03875 [Thermacetogeniaceae bacterium]
MRYKWYPVALLAILLLVVTSSCSRTESPVGTRPPAFTLQEINHQQFSFPDSMKGKKTALVFFSYT